MPITNSPPYNISQPRVLQRWLDVNSQNGPLQRCNTYVTIPAFDETGAIWLGYSDIVAEFCYTSPNNFSLKKMRQYPVPSNLPFLMCINWADSARNYRYALNNNENAIIYFDLPQYTNQKIGRSFSIEIWNCNGQDAVLDDPITLYTSVVQNIDYRFGEDTSLATSIVCPVKIPYALAATASIGFGPDGPDNVVLGNPDAGIVFGQPGSQ